MSYQNKCYFKLSIKVMAYFLFYISFSSAQSTLEQEWVREYTGDYEMQDSRDIAVDDSGNVYVGITSFDTISSYGFTLIKYNTDGQIKWTRKYEGPFTPDTSKSKDYVQDIAIDYENNIYLTGRSEFLQSDPYDVHTTFVTIKYNSDGEQQWLSKFRIDSLEQGWYWPYTIAVDSSRNVYVGGNFDKSILLKYNPFGNLLWQRNIESVSTVKGIILDEKANIYIPGTGLSITKYDSSGNLKWVTCTDSLEGIDVPYIGYISMDKKNNIYINSAYKTNYINNKVIVIVKYDRDGTFRWKREHGEKSPYITNAPVGCVLDNVGNIYLGGIYYNENTRESRFMVIKYDSSGNQIWITNFDAPANTSLDLKKIAMDTEYNIYLIGSVDTFDINDYNFAIVKFDSSGNLLYSDFYGVFDRNEQAMATAIDNYNNVYITGDSYSSKGQKVITLKYIQKPVSIEPINKLLPVNPELYQNYPNPFNSVTKIPFFVSQKEKVRISVYDILGREVSVVLNSVLSAGKFEVEWNALNQSSGVYICKMQTKSSTVSRKILLIK